MKIFFSRGLILSSILILVAGGCADQPLPVSPGIDSPTASAGGNLSGGGSDGKISQETFQSPGSGMGAGGSGATSGGFQTDGRMAGENSRSGGLGNLGGDPSTGDSAETGSSPTGDSIDDFISGPLTGDGSLQRNFNNDFAGSGFDTGSGTSDGRGSEGQVASTLPSYTTENLKDIFFAYDKYDLTEQSKSVLAKNAGWLNDNPNVRIEIQGHCDERGTNNYNLGLGERRAQSTKNYLVSLGVPKRRILTISYGEEKPFCVQSSEGCWTQNRRGHFMVAR